MNSEKSTNYDKLIDTLDKKILDFNLKILGFFASLLIKPLALCTEPFFRKKFGERYLTGTNFVLSMFLWSMVQSASNATDMWSEASPLQKMFAEAHMFKIANWIHNSNLSGHVGYWMAFAYGFLGMLNLIFARSRRSTGEMWHSMSRGESLFGRESKARDIMISIGAIVILCTVAPGVGSFFFFSRLTSFFLEAKQQASLYNRYLDAMDAKIEAELLQQALDKGEPPRDTDGLYCPLPKNFKGKYRTRVARVVAGGPFDPNAPETAREVPRPRPPAAGAPSSPEVPSRPLAAHLESATKAGTAVAANVIDWFVRSKRLIRTVAFWLFVIACASIAIGLIRKIPFHRHRPVVATATQSAQPQQTPPEVAQSAAPVVSERATQLAEYTNILANKIATLANFTAVCENKLDANDAKLPGFDVAKRATLKQKNESARKTIEETLKTQADTLKGYLVILNAYSNKSLQDPQSAFQRLTDYYAKMEMNHNDIAGIFAGLDKNFAPDPAENSAVLAAVNQHTDTTPTAAVKAWKPLAQSAPPIAPTASANADPAPTVPVTTVPPALEATIIPQNSKPIDPRQNMLVAAVNALNTFSNYCATTLATDNDQIARISNNSIRAKLNAKFLQDQAWVSNIITNQQQYLDNLTPGADADATLGRSNPNLIISRQDATNELMKLDAEIYNAGFRR